jgi:hypothetical protein
MRHRVTFLAGLAVGLVAGARAGRERYDQLKGVAQKVADSPAVRKTTKAVGQKAGELTKAAGHQAAEQLPKLTESAKNSAGKVRSQLARNHDGDHLTGTETGTGTGTGTGTEPGTDYDDAAVNGSRPVS